MKPFTQMFTTPGVGRCDRHQRPARFCFSVPNKSLDQRRSSFYWQTEYASHAGIAQRPFGRIITKSFGRTPRARRPRAGRPALTDPLSGGAARRPTERDAARRPTERSAAQRAAASRSRSSAAAPDAPRGRARSPRRGAADYHYFDAVASARRRAAAGPRPRRRHRPAHLTATLLNRPRPGVADRLPHWHALHFSPMQDARPDRPRTPGRPDCRSHARQLTEE
jgi:hypothetical protein